MLCFKVFLVFWMELSLFSYKITSIYLNFYVEFAQWVAGLGPRPMGSVEPTLAAGQQLQSCAFSREARICAPSWFAHSVTPCC